MSSLQDDISNKLGCIRRVTILDGLDGITLGQSNGSSQVTEMAENSHDISYRENQPLSYRLET
jgi:hypothetical protein